MPTDLVASVTKLLTPQLISRVASALGVDQAVVEKAVAAVVPTLLTMFASLAGKPGGAARLSDAVAQQPATSPASLANAVSSGGELAATGLGALSSLLGGTSVSALATAVCKYAGIGEGASKGLMGLLGPMVMGVLGQQQRAGGLDASGLAQLLQSQKGTFTRALPADFASYLSGTGILDRGAGATVKEPAWREPAQPSSQWNWVLPLVGALMIGALAWYLFARTPSQTVATVPPTGAENAAPGAVTFIVTADKATDWIGRPVYSRDNKKIGEIIELKRGPDDKVTDIYIDTGTYLGMGATRYRIGSDQVREVKPDALVLTLSDVEAQQMPQVETKQQP